MGIDCENTTSSVEPNLNDFVADLLSNYSSNKEFTNSFKFSINDRNYLFYLKSVYDSQTGSQTVIAELVDETSCYEDTCTVIDSLDLSYVDTYVTSTVYERTCDDLKNIGQIKSTPIYDSLPFAYFYGVYEDTQDEYLAVVKFYNSAYIEEGSSDLYLFGGFSMFLIFRLSSSSITLEAIEIPFLRAIPSESCLPSTLTHEAEDVKMRYDGNSIFSFSGLFYNSEDLYTQYLVLYLLNTKTAQADLLVNQLIQLSSNPSDYGITLPSEWESLEISEYNINFNVNFVENANDLLVLQLSITLDSYGGGESNLSYGVILFRVVKLDDSYNVIFSDFYTAAFVNDLNQMLIDLPQAAWPFGYHSESVFDGVFVKIGNKMFLIGNIDYVRIQDVPELEETNVIFDYSTLETFKHSIVIYNFDESNLTLTFEGIYDISEIHAQSSDSSVYHFYNSTLPIFETKTTNFTNPPGIFLNSDAKADVCQILSSKYSLTDCSQMDFYFINEDWDRSFMQLNNADQFAFDDCNVYRIMAFRFLDYDEAFYSSTNLNPTNEFLVIVLFKFSVDEQGNTKVEYKILDVITLSVINPGDTYISREEAVYIPKAFFDNQKRLHYSVYVYSELPQGGGGGVAA
ncbi:hypothetical protein TMA_081 [Thermus phage TMA]|uniref:hypothetical protein n=1 Tax=Thermus phage TMA TaxID=699370 RepID=UPI00021AADC2|nr:hypothetical protein TMA_081 [Thermus phage TMA]BAK53769.1 hypothetical protein TMA_081 [Thermus phage TMA]